MNINDVRAKFPQYSDLSDEQLADSLHRRFYSDMDPAEFRAQIGLSQASPKPAAARISLPEDTPTPKLPDAQAHSDFSAQLVDLMTPKVPAVAAAGSALAPKTSIRPKVRPALDGAAPQALSPAPLESTQPPNFPAPEVAPIVQPLSAIETAMGLRPSDKPSGPEIPDWIKQALGGAGLMQSAPPAQATADPVSPLATIQTAMGLQPDRLTANPATPDWIKQALGPQPVPAAEVPGPFAGEGIGPLAKRRGQQFAVGAGEVIATVPESLAIASALQEKDRKAGAGNLKSERAKTIDDIKVRLADQGIDPATRAFLEQNLADLTVGQAELGARESAPVQPAGDREMFKRGGSVRSAITDAVGAPDPRDQGFWGQVAQGGGNMVGMIGASLAGGLVAGPGGALAAGGMSGAALNAPSIYKEAIDAGADEQTALAAAKIGAAIGVTEIIPISRALKILPRGAREKFTNGMLRRFTDIAHGAGEEAAQEYLSQVANNILAQKLYDPTRGWTDGATDAALVGAILGGGVGAAGTAFDRTGKVPAKSPGRDNERDQEQDPADTPAAALPSDQALTPESPASAPQAAPQAGRQITRADADANPDRYEILPEIEGQGRNSKPTGRDVVLDNETGLVHPLAPDTVAAPPAAAGAPGGVDGAGQSQDAPAQGSGGIPAAGPTTEADVVASSGDAAPPTPAGSPNQPRNFEFVDAAGVRTIGTEPGVMQYKSGGNTDGVTDRLKGVTEWKPERAGMSIIYEYADGRRVIADGHQRLDLAKRLAANGKKIQMPAMVLRQVDGVTPQEARTTAALKNIAEGSGTATDAAKVLRDSSETIDQLGLPQNSAIVRDATGMRNLSDDAFGMVVNGAASERDGGIVGRIVTDKAAQANILALMGRLKPANAFQAEQIARQAAADTVTETQDSLFGPETDTQNLYLERAKILDGASKLTRDEMRAFKNVNDNADRLQSAGNVLDAAGNQTRLDSAASVRDYLQAEANTKGAISEALTAAARALHGGATAAAATRQFLAAVERELAARGAERPSGDQRGQAPGNLRPQESQDQTVKQADQDREDAASIGDMFGGPVAKADINVEIDAEKSGTQRPESATPEKADAEPKRTPWADAKTGDYLRPGVYVAARKIRNKANAQALAKALNGNLSLDGNRAWAVLVGEKLTKASVDAEISKIKAGPSVEATDAGPQTVIPGAERDDAGPGRAAQARAEAEAQVRAQQSKLRTSKPQNDAGPLFGPPDDDLFSAPKAEAKPAEPTIGDAFTAAGFSVGKDTDARVIFGSRNDKAGRWVVRPHPGSRFKVTRSSDQVGTVAIPTVVVGIFDTEQAAIDAVQADGAILPAGIAPKRAAVDGAELIQRGRAILLQHTNADDGAHDAKSGKDHRDTDEGRQLADDLARAKTMAAKSKVADAWVLKHGHATGLEYLVVLDSDGAPLAIMSGTSVGVSAHAATFRAAEAGLVGYATHNHPRSTGFSGPDIAMFFNGFAPLSVVGHDGKVATIAVAPGVKVDGGVKFGKLNDAFSGVKYSAEVHLNSAALKLEGLTTDQQHARWIKATRHASSAILDRMGIVRYDQTDAVAQIEALGFNFEDIYGQVSSNVADRLRRAGLQFPEIGDHRGDQTAGKRANAASPETDGTDQGTARGPEKETTKVSNSKVTGDSDFDGAMDALFGKGDGDVSGPSFDLERSGRDGASADSVGTGDVSATGRSASGRTESRGGADPEGNGQPGAGGSISDGNAAALGIAGDQGADGQSGADSQPAAGRNSGRGNDGGRGGLPSEPIGKSETAGNASDQADLNKDDADLIGNLFGGDAAAAPAEKIDDFGDKIGGARKDVWAGFKSKMADAEGLDTKTEPLSKSFPEPNYEAMIAAEVDPWIVGFVRAAREMIPRKPVKAWKLNEWAEQVELLRGFSNDLINGTITRKTLEDKIGTEGPLTEQLLGTVGLYLEVGHGRSLRGIKVRRSTYSVLNGITHNPARKVWEITKDQTATAFSNMPRVFAQGDTKAEMIEAFRRVYDQVGEVVRSKKEPKLEVYSRDGRKTWNVGAKVGKAHIDLRTGIETVEEARNIRDEQWDDIQVELKQAREIPSERKDIDAPRVGQDHRMSADITPQIFGDTFGFRGVEFGNYVDGPRRQQDLNNAYDALMDMANVLGLPPQSLSLNGTLGLAFGARGVGGNNAASAHFEPDKIVINLTKTQGRGSLAHEWFHALDNYFARQRQPQRGTYITDNSTPVGPLLQGIRTETISAFIDLRRSIMATDLKKRSQNIDRLRSTPYWGTGIEMHARAFESYLIDRLDSVGVSNDYLANVVNGTYWSMVAEASGLGNSYPYLTKAEIENVGPKYDALFKALITEQTETGIALREDNSLFHEPVGLNEDRTTGIDRQKYDALKAMFERRLMGVDLANMPRQQVFMTMMKPLVEAGVSRDQLVAMKPYFDLYLDEWAAGRTKPQNPAPKQIESESRDAVQAEADKVRVKPADRENIDKTLPLLIPEQRDDVFKIETRFAKPDGHGMMITNGTGTGKTYSGGGVVKRFVQQGKGNILIVAPSDAVIAGWIGTLKALGVPATALANTKDAGKGVVITTYANLNANNAVATRDWDLIVTDEAQNLMSSAQAGATGALDAMRAISHRPSDLYRKSRMLHAADWARQAEMPKGEAKTAEYHRLKEREARDVAAWSSKPRSKVLFLSATPFAYDKTIDYAEGYLFDYPKDGRLGNSNQGGQNIFMVQNFGYRIRYHKLTKPEHAVDSAVFERDFHEKLKRDGVLSGRSLQVDVDYDRRFIRRDDADGTRLDEAIEALDVLAKAEREKRGATVKAGVVGSQVSQPFSALQSHMSKNFDYLARQQLLEAIKAKLAIGEIKANLALGRKVVVFHDFNVGGGLNPFTHLKTKGVGIDEATGEDILVPVSPMTADAADGYRMLLDAHPWIADLNFTGYKPPIEHIPSQLGKSVRLFNGRVQKPQRLKNLADFNLDGSGVDVLVVQADAGGAGLSMHDLSGVHQRVLINLGMPTKPTTTLQQEGRILRVGSMTDAAFRYFTIGTTWERTAFAKRIAERSGTVENLALGNEARDMMNAFIDAYMEASDFTPSDMDGKGGKVRDQRTNSTTPFQRAMSHYFGRQKISGRRDQREGIDFYPTAEPLAFKMVEWAAPRANERVLEPSAGDGAIARYMPDDVDLTMVEPSSDLGSTAQLRAPRGNLISSRFEDFNIVNKAHVIIMNPPFGSGGKTAMDHMAKAARHLRPGGRLVALIPSGPSADARFDAWWTSDAAKEFNWTADIALPAVAFERAGTSVMSRVVILDRIPDNSERAQYGAGNGGPKRPNFTGATNIKDFFERIEGYDVPRRPDAKQDVIDELAAEGQDATAAIDTRRPGPPLASDIGAITKTTVQSKSGKTFPSAYHAAKVERAVYDQMSAAARAHDGWWHKNAGTPRGAGPTFAFRTEVARDAFLDDMQKPTIGGMEETAPVFNEDPQADIFAAEFMREMAQVDDLFQNPRSGATTLAGAMSDIDPTIKYEGKLDADDPRAAGKDAEDVFMFTASKGQPVYIMQNAGEVWVDVSNLSKGDGGSGIYSAVSDYALNTGKVFIGDPEGLSVAALRRRTDNMLSTALKHGTTRHIAPHQYQIDGDPRFGILGLRWTEGNDVANLQSLIDASVSNLIGLVPEIADARYDFETRTFRTGEGKPVTDGILVGWGLDSERNRAPSAGRATIKRGILLNTLAHSEVEDRPGLLERALQQSRELVTHGGLARTFYQTPPQLVRDAASATAEVRRIMPDLRAELDRLDLKRVRLSQNEGDGNWQGAFTITGEGEMEIVIGASLDPVKTLHHEVIHALRAMNLFTTEEWRALSLAAEKSWAAKHNIAARYPTLTVDEHIEEAIAEEFSEAMAGNIAPKGSVLIRAFNKIARLFRAFRTVLTGKGYDTPEKIFGAVLSGEISNRTAGNTGARSSIKYQRPRAVRPLTAQGRAHRNSAIGSSPFIPDRRVWETLTEAGVPIWKRLRDVPGAASDAVDRARYVIQDRFLPVLRAQDAVMRQTGRNLPKEHDAYIAETTFSGKVGRHLLEVDEEFTKPIIQIIATSKGKMDADSVGQWLYARHAVERNAYIASINPMMPDAGSGMTNAEAATILQDIAGSNVAADYNRIGALIDALRERNLTLRENAGLISNNEANLWRTQYKHYVPLKGFDETDHAEAMMSLGGVGTGRRFSIRGPESKRALGRKSEAFNPLQSAITQAQEVAIRAEKNRVAQAMHGLAVSYPSKALWEVKKPKQKRYFNRSTGLVETRAADPLSMVMEPNEMAVKIDGEEHRILFHDERLAAAAGTLGADHMAGIMRILSMFSRFFSMTRTMLNPEFMITNATRDFQTAQFNIQAFGEGDKARIAKAMAKNWRKAFMGAMRGSTYRFDTEWSRYYAEFQKAGAQVWFWTMEQPEVARGDLDKRIGLARGNKAQRALKIMSTPSAFFSFRDNSVLSFIERTNLAVDNAIRLAAFVEARKAGWTVEKAAFMAKELTVNFNRRGEAGASMNALYPFFNAAVQGTVRTVKALSSRRVAMMVAAAFAAGALNDLLNASLSDEDDDGELVYDKIPNFRNERNFHMVLWFAEDKNLSIPMPYGYNIFPYAGQQLGKVMRGVKQADEAFADVAAAAFGAFSPIGASTPAQFVSPFITDPLVEMAENKNWVGIPIYPQDYGNKTEPDAFIHFKGASEVSKWVAQSLNSLTGGDFRESGAIDVSPETLDHLSSFVGGSATAFWGRSADFVAKALKGDFDGIEARSVPFLRNLTSPVNDWQDRSRFYDFQSEVKNAQADQKAYAAAGDPIPKKTAALASLYDALLKANRELRGTGEWNPNKSGSLAPRTPPEVYLDFNGKFLHVMGKQGE